MTETEKDRIMDVLRQAVAESSQAQVSRRIGRSPAAISQVLKGSYAGDTATVLELVAAEYGGAAVECPIMGSVALTLCIESRNIVDFRPTNHQRVRLWKMCRDCERNPRR